MALKQLLRKISTLKAKMLQNHKYDKVNISDEVRVRSPLAKKLFDKEVEALRKVLRTQEDVVMETDINTQARLALQQFVFLADAKNTSGNLISVELIDNAGTTIKVKDFAIKINFDSATEDHAAIKVRIDASAQASALISVTVNAGQDATAVAASAPKFLIGAK